MFPILRGYKTALILQFYSPPLGMVMLQLKRNPEKVFWKCIGGYCSCSVISLQAVFKMYSTLNSVCTISQPCAMQCPVLRSLFLLGPVADYFLPSPTNEWMLRCCLSFFLQCNFTSIYTVAPQMHIVGTSWILNIEWYERLKFCLHVCQSVTLSLRQEHWSQEDV